MSTTSAYGNAGIIPLQYLLEVLPFPRQSVGPVLAQAHAMAIAGDVERYLLLSGLSGEVGRAQTQDRPGLAAGDLHSANRDLTYRPGGVGAQALYPICLLYTSDAADEYLVV